VVRPPLPTKTPRRGRLSPKPVVNMPYMGIPNGGLARDDGTVSWEDTAALDYVRDVRGPLATALPCSKSILMRPQVPWLGGVAPHR